MMPNMDGTGPRCAGMRNSYGYGRHMGVHGGYGICRGLGRYPDYPSEKEALAAQKEALKQRLAAIDKRLETL
ncbi:MAG: DUF5320 domain-containing protein [Eubacteriales bacterium]|nr:DUF5320 domain-containing protein [Eubacteriales bacterium]